MNFSGPVFIVGMPRSGTKLLRDLLNQHSHISIPSMESHFIPSFIERYGLGANLKDKEKLREIYQDFCRTTFYINFHRIGRILSWETLQSNSEIQDWPSLIAFIFKYYADKEGEFLWGDKTPAYLHKLDLLLALFPHSKIIHIVRDPRDYVLSVNKTWGRSMLRAAQRWRDAMLDVREKKIPEYQYRTVFYEELLENPHQNLSTLCEFLGVAFEDHMTKLNKASEKEGDAKGKTSIVSTNKQKFLTQIPPRKLKQIESIICDQAQALGFQMENNIESTTLSPLHIKLLKYHDGIKSQAYHIRSKGFIKGISYFFQLHKEKS